MTIDPKILEECGKAICGFIGDIKWEDLPEVASYRQRKFATHAFCDRAEIKELVQACLKEYERLKPSPWRPIEEAPRDGTDILILTFMKIPDVAYWQEDVKWGGRGGWVNYEGTTYHPSPTHFMPIPKLMEE